MSSVSDRDPDTLEETYPTSRVSALVLDAFCGVLYE